MASGLFRMLARRLPLRSDRGVAHRLVLAAGAARDAQAYLAAAGLYEEALHYRPELNGLHIQAGHMFKEAGAMARAEHHYLAARDRMPADADLALQLGHFYKIAGRPDEAEAAYARALALRPGWPDPAEEMARLSPVRGDSGDVIAALLPRPARVAGARGEGVHLHRLGTRAQPTPWGDLKRLSGIEAIRGHCFSASELNALQIAIDDVEIHREPLSAVDAGAVGKYPFNAWIDVSELEPGAHRIDLHFMGPSGLVRTHRETIAVMPPMPLPRSDASVVPPAGPGTLEQRIATLPSVARPAARIPFAGPFRTVLVQRADQLGDLVASVPAITRLRALFADARLIGLVTPANAGLAGTMGLFDELVIVTFEEDDGGLRALSATAQGDLRRRLAAFDIDLAIDLGQTPASRPLLLLSGARILYGFADGAPWLDAGFALDGHDPINRHDTIPPARKLLAMIENLAVMLQAAPRSPLAVRPDLSRFGIAREDRYIVLHAGARLVWSRWPHYRALAALLLAQTDLHILLLGDEYPAPLPGDGRLQRIDGMMSFAEFDALLGHCALFIGNDSGPKHLAALRGVPVLSLHMARLNWSEWGQEGNGTILSRRVPCAGCGIGQGEDCAKGFTCIRDIAPEEALTEALRLLGALPKAR